MERNSHSSFVPRSFQTADVLTFIAPAVWILLAFLHLTILCIGSGKVNDAAHALTDSVYLTSFKRGASPELLNKVVRESVCW